MSRRKVSRRGGRKGRSGHKLSGNPQRREQQLQTRRSPVSGNPPLELVRSFAGGADPAPWWQDSHERILDRARELTVPTGPRELEQVTCDVVGAEYWECLQKQEEGFHRTQWLQALVEKTGAALPTNLKDSTWPSDWLLLQGLATIAPPPRDPRTHVHELRSRFAIKDPYETAQESLRHITKRLDPEHFDPADRWLAEPIVREASGEPLVLRDIYGTRVALVAPFSYTGRSVPDTHWYCWDIDQCWNDEVVGAGVFDSAGEALAEWSATIGPEALAGTDPIPCPPEEAAKLLRWCMLDGPLGEGLYGTEPRQFITELFRLKRRARELIEHLAVESPQRSTEVPTELVEDFRTWYVARHDVQPEFDDVYSLADNWGPSGCTAPLFYGCSPHRITKATILINDGIMDEYVPGIMRLMPAWVDWCLERSGLDGDPAVRSRAAAREAVAAQRPAGGWDEWRPAPFRPPE